MKKTFLSFFCICMIVFFASCGAESNNRKAESASPETMQADSTLPEEIRQILDNRGSKSNAEVNAELQAVAEARKQDCEKIKDDILNALKAQYYDNPFLVAHMDLAEILQGFSAYCDAALRHVEDRKTFNENVLIPFVFNGGTASGQSLFIHEYNCYDRLYAELQEILNEIS